MLALCMIAILHDFFMVPTHPLISTSCIPRSLHDALPSSARARQPGERGKLALALQILLGGRGRIAEAFGVPLFELTHRGAHREFRFEIADIVAGAIDRKSTRLNSSH